jgi:hypothetical protein
MERIKSDPIRVRVTSAAASDAVGRGLMGRNESLKHILFWLFPAGIKKALTYRGITLEWADADEDADVVIEVLGRERSAHHIRSLQFRVTAGGYTGVHFGFADTDQVHEAARHAARYIRNWVAENYESLIVARD